MTKDKNIQENLQLLDNIISYLINDCTHYNSEFSALYKYFTGRKLEEDNQFNSSNMFHSLLDKVPESIEDYLSVPPSDNTRAEGEKIVLACYYLYKKNLIQLNQNFNIKLTFDGIIEYAKGGLYQKFKSEKYKNWLDHFNVYITICISILSMLLGTWIGYLAL